MQGLNCSYRDVSTRGVRAIIRLLRGGGYFIALMPQGSLRKHATNYSGFYTKSYKYTLFVVVHPFGTLARHP